MSENILLPCNHCGAVNRVLTTKLKDSPKCGQCKNIISFPDKPVIAGSATFQKEVLNWPGLVLVDFWADWCGPCKMIAPVLEKLAAERAGKLKIVKIDTEKEQSLSAQFRITSIPTLMLFRKGQKVDQVSGALPKPQLEQWIDSVRV